MVIVKYPKHFWHNINLAICISLAMRWSSIVIKWVATLLAKSVLFTILSGCHFHCVILKLVMIPDRILPYTNSKVVLAMQD